MEHKTEKQTNDDEPKLTGDDWHEFGPYLVLLILPFLAVKFRRGATLMAVVLVGYISQPQVVYANNEETNSSLHTAPQTNPQLVGAEAPQQTPELPPKTPWYHKVFKRGDQVAQAHYDAENYAQAAVDFDDPKWKGAAAYKAKDFETALNYFSQDDSPTGWYNRGNALANLGQLDEAIAAYDKVLAKRPQHDGALKNKALLEQLKQQQEQQQQNQQDGEQQDQQQDGGQEQNSDQQQSSEGDNQSQSGEEQQNQQQNGEQNEAAEPSPQENSETGEEQQSQQSQQNDQQAEDEQQAAQAAEQQDQQQDGQESDETAQSQFTPLTPEQLAEQEQQQKIEQLLRKVSDDPATLLRNKMILENRKRQPNNRAPKGAKKSW